jgi:hypothetical protein
MDNNENGKERLSECETTGKNSLQKSELSCDYEQSTINCIENTKKTFLVTLLPTSSKYRAHWLISIILAMRQMEIRRIKFPG